jgi:hypothetical protein
MARLLVLLACLAWGSGGGGGVAAEIEVLSPRNRCVEKRHVRIEQRILVVREEVR